MPSAGFIYLLVYNIMFVIPLVAILFVATNRRVAERIERAEKTNIKYITLFAGIVMVVLGIALWFFVAGGH